MTASPNICRFGIAQYLLQADGFSELGEGFGFVSELLEGLAELGQGIDDVADGLDICRISRLEDGAAAGLRYGFIVTRTMSEGGP